MNISLQEDVFQKKECATDVPLYLKRVELSLNWQLLKIVPDSSDVSAVFAFSETQNEAKDTLTLVSLV